MKIKLIGKRNLTKLLLNTLTNWFPRVANH
jgi:hypothetical protein